MATLAGIVGYRGYSGAELARILERHPRVTPVLLEHREDAAVHPRPQGPSGPRHVPCTPEAVLAEGISIVFLATPAEDDGNLRRPCSPRGFPSSSWPLRPKFP